ncbi:DNA adenine methylase [Gloeothece verrucosa]|uniref:site-specific DNA-methyltransferase (adenine-specific) n=1 Tax=Gloeothece verrucosa (strain PCC 7822) TaxID=497965 RepID=E0UIG8_GLOV7|nr:DNA adenine methylase [Gloeothece verrucosa]ADN12162.1 D12 class N6 adenine-specific DNA methyltransferase [Gloeothece verrucosa PCC 7822]
MSKKNSSIIKSPLRYPGGKSRAIQTIIQYLPEKFSEYREPFIGGGSVFIYLKQKYPDLKYWINDLNPELFIFWKIAQSDLKTLIEKIRQVKAISTEGKKLFVELTTINPETLSELERAARFFILNRITFSGTVESGGYSEQSFHKRFTDSSIERLEKLETILKDVKITNLDYSDLLLTPGKNVFSFLDPPYFYATPSRLYGKDGNLHTSFDHSRFAHTVKQCQHQWLITYDNSPEITKNFADFNLFEWELQYGMNNYKQEKAAKGKELMISNYLVKPNQTLKSVEQLNLNLFY